MLDNEKENGAFGAGALIGAGITLILMLCIARCAVQATKQEAIKAGVAHYEVDDKGEVTFHYNTDKEKH